MHQTGKNCIALFNVNSLRVVLCTRVSCRLIKLRGTRLEGSRSVLEQEYSTASCSNYPEKNMSPSAKRNVVSRYDILSVIMLACGILHETACPSESGKTIFHIFGTPKLGRTHFIHHIISFVHHELFLYMKCDIAMLRSKFIQAI